MENLIEVSDGILDLVEYKELTWFERHHPSMWEEAFFYSLGPVWVKVKWNEERKMGDARDMYGTLFNVAMIVAGSLIGSLFKKGIKDKYHTILMHAMGLKQW